MQQPESEYPFPSRHCTTLLSQGCFPFSPFVTLAYPFALTGRAVEPDRSVQRKCPLPSRLAGRLPSSTRLGVLHEALARPPVRLGTRVHEQPNRACWLQRPLRFDTPARRRDAQWLVEQLKRLKVVRPVHLRGLHYIIASAADAVRPNGDPDINDELTYLKSTSNHRDAVRASRNLPDPRPRSADPPDQRSSCGHNRIYVACDRTANRRSPNLAGADGIV